MYATVFKRRSGEIYAADRVVDDYPTSPITEQQVESYQLCEITLMCATQEEYAQAMDTIYDSEWHHNVSDNINPVQAGLNLFKGTITCQRYLNIGDTDNGEYVAGLSSIDGAL